MMSQRSQGALRRNAMRFLVCAETQSRAALEEIDSAGQWGELVELSADWNVLSGLETRLAALTIEMPSMERSELGRLASRAFIQSTLCLRAGAKALSTLQQAGIHCAGFKGLATLAYLYAGPRSRTLQDVDVLVHPGDVVAALAALQQVGFSLSGGGDWEEHLKFVRQSPGAAGNEAVSLTDPEGGAVDLHWRLGCVNVETILAGVRSVPILGRSLPLIGPGHSMLLTAHHALRNDLVPDDVARDICDFAQWEALLNHSPGWDSIRIEAERWGLTQSCLALALIVTRIRDSQDHADSSAEPPFSASRADRNAAGRLSDLYFHQLIEGGLNTDVVYLTSYRPLFQIVSSAATGWGKYRDSMRRSEQVNGELSLPLPQRLWRAFMAALRLTPARWLQVRALARAKDGMLRGAGRSRRALP